MTKRPTVSDVADRAGVHRSTAARALNPATAGMLTAETVERVTHAADALGYSVNAFARGLRTNRSLTVGVLIPDLNNPLFPPIVRGIEEALLPHGYTALIANTDNDVERETSHFRALLARRVDGFLVATAHDNDAILDEAHSTGLATVLINRGNNRRQFPLVSGDDRDGIRAAVEHLVELGHRRIAHLAGPDNVSTARERRAAFAEAIHAHGLTTDETAVVSCSGFTEEAATVGTRLLLERCPATTAVVAANDLIALGALRTFAAHGLACPTDISVVGFNDMRFADAFNPPLTTVHVPHRAMGGEAAKLLLELLEEPTTPPKTLLLPLQLVVRSSTGPPRSQVVAAR